MTSRYVSVATVRAEDWTGALSELLKRRNLITSERHWFDTESRINFWILELAAPHRSLQLSVSEQDGHLAIYDGFVYPMHGHQNPRSAGEVLDAILAPYRCEYTPDGADSQDACGRPAVISNPHFNGDYEEWFCAQHADPAWLGDRARPVAENAASSDERLWGNGASLATCEYCDHGMIDHTFFPGPDGKLGDPAGCEGGDIPGDGPCECEGWVPANAANSVEETNR